MKSATSVAQQSYQSDLCPLEPLEGEIIYCLAGQFQWKSKGEEIFVTFREVRPIMVRPHRRIRMNDAVTLFLAATTDQLQPRGIDWDLVLKAFGFIVSAFVAYSQIKNLQSGSRTALKTDLEILKLIDANDPNYEIVKQRISERVQILYSRQVTRKWGEAVLGLILSFGFAYWTFRLVQHGFTWWSLLTGYLAFAGIGMTLNALRGRSSFVMPFKGSLSFSGDLQHDHIKAPKT